MEEKFLAGRGVAYRTNHHVEGRPTLLFIHGLSGSSSAWLPFEERFKDFYNIITYDLRGHGKSIRPTHYRDYNLDAFVEDLRSLVEELRLSSFLLIAHSFGTLIALSYVEKYPGKAQKTLMLSAVVGMKKRFLMRFFEPLVAASTLWLRLFSYSPRRGHKRVDYRHLHNTGDWSARRVIPDVLTTGLRPYIWCLSQLYHLNTGEMWRSVHMPLSFVHGTKDSYIPLRYVSALVSRLPHSSLLRIEGANHMLVLNNVKEVSEIIEQCVQKMYLEKAPTPHVHLESTL